MNISVSAAVDPAKFYWMRYSSDRATVINVRNGKARIEKNALFGVREIKGKPEDEILLVDGTKFRLAVAKSEQLMDKAKEFKGRTPVITTGSTKKPVKIVKPAPKVQARPEPKPTLVPLVGTPPIIKVKKRPTTMTKLVPAAEKNGVVKIKLSKIELPEEDDFTDHDIPAEFRQYTRSESKGKIKITIR